jgi:hypothetical protein
MACTCKSACLEGASLDLDFIVISETTSDAERPVTMLTRESGSVGIAKKQNRKRQ